MEKRSVNLDIVRIIAFLMVISVHSLKYSGFYNISNSGITMALFQILRVFFMTCVPLFITLSGYLMCKKEYSKSYYLKLSRIIITYIICSILCLIITNGFQGLNSFFDAIKNCILKIMWFEAAPYSWYINMYIGLYLFIPFLNKLWSSLKTKKEQTALIITLFLVVVFPTIVNIKFMIVPNYWVGESYILLYYFIGAYLKDNNIQLSIYKKILLFGICVISGLLSYYLCYGGTFINATYNEYYSLGTFAATILLFTTINSLKININNKYIIHFIKKMSALTLGAYLLSYVFDVTIYDKLLVHSIFQRNIPFVFLSIIIIFVLSLLLSFFEYLIESFLKLIWKKLKLIFRINNN